MLSILADLQFAVIAALLGWLGVVPWPDLAIAALASIYIYTMATFVFTPVTTTCPPPLYNGNQLLIAYVTVAAYVGLYLPLAYSLLATWLYHLPPAVVSGAARHTFLLACQVVSEQLTGTCRWVSLPARALVPILYNSVRLVYIASWFHTSFFGDAHGDKLYMVFDRVLALLNLILWTYNLLGFLVPMYLPLCFRRYFEDEKVWKEKKE